MLQDSEGPGYQDQLILKEMDYCSRKELRCIFDHLTNKACINWVSCLVLANRVRLAVVLLDG